MEMSVDDWVIVGVIFVGLYLVSNTVSGINTILGNDTANLPTSAPPAAPVEQDVVFSPGICPSGYIADTNGNCIQVTGAIHS